ncbi:BnaC02g41400D [Brassica napus]|uniref:BnaC02g41400D protein n=1 Tax=Brassica napus TaxID=3708 RepID=A0A078I2K2_BRANA|nr:BnaC02g41400D [Brassica napus]
MTKLLFLISRNRFDGKLTNFTSSYFYLIFYYYEHKTGSLPAGKLARRLNYKSLIVLRWLSLIVLQTKKRDMPELPRRIYTLGEEPPAVHSISYHTCWTLHTALKKALHDDEYEELKESKLGVSIKFQELEFDWASRLVHYMLGSQLDIKKNLARLVMELEWFENYPWGRVAFKVLIDSVKGRDISGCYTINGFAQALQVWVYTALPELGANYGNPLPNNPSPPILAYKGRKGHRQFKEAILSQTRVINFVEKDIGEMFPKWEFDVEDTHAENIIKLMFAKKPWKWTMDCWEVTDTWVNTKSAVVKVVKEDNPKPRKKARKEAAAEASEEAAAEASEEVHTVARSEVTTTVGGLTKEDIKTMFKDVVDAMRERVEAVEKKVGITTKRKGTVSQNTGTWTSAQNTIPPPKPTLEPGSKSVNGTNAGRNSLAEDKGPDVPTDASSSKDKAPEPSLVLLDKKQPTVSDLQKENARYQEKRDAALALCRAKSDAALALCRAKSDRTRKLVASQQSPYTANITTKMIIPNKKLYPGYNPFAPIDKKKLKELADWLKTCP